MRRKISFVGPLILGLVLFISGSAAAILGGGRPADGPPGLEQKRANQPPSAQEIRAARSGVAADRQFLQLKLGTNHRLVEPQPLMVEGERRGVVFIVELGEPLELTGPWVAIDERALLRKARPDLNPSVAGYDHDQLASLLADVDVDADDYETLERTESVTTSRLFVAYDSKAGRILALRPFNPPPDPPRAASQGRSGEVPTPASVPPSTRRQLDEQTEVGQ